MRQCPSVRGDYGSVRSRQPQLRRTTSWVGRTTSRRSRRAVADAGRGRPARRAAPRSCIGWRTVVSGGARCRVAAMSSKPVTATSAGTLTFARLSTGERADRHLVVAADDRVGQLARGRAARATARAPPVSVNPPTGVGTVAARRCRLSAQRGAEAGEALDRVGRRCRAADEHEVAAVVCCSIRCSTSARVPPRLSAPTRSRSDPRAGRLARATTGTLWAIVARSWSVRLRAITTSPSTLLGDRERQVAAARRRAWPR